MMISVSVRCQHGVTPESERDQGRGQQEDGRTPPGHSRQTLALASQFLEFMILTNNKSVQVNSSI